MCPMPAESRPSHFLPFALALLAVAATGSAEEVSDDFESGANPNQWSWTNTQGVVMITPQGGNPGAWVDTGAPYFAGHPRFSAVPPAGSSLRAALSSGSLHTASIDLQRLDTSQVQGCLPTHTQASFVSLALVDLHSADVAIEARTTQGPGYPAGPFAWQSARFDIPSDAIETPPGWELVNPSDIDYTWVDLMHNIDGITFYVGDPDQQAFSSCSHLGADNAVISYGAGDSIFVDGFDAAAMP